MSREPDQPRRPSGDYAVGYCRPPKEHQFRSGESGNPRGRPEGAPTLEDLFAREARRLVKLKRGDEIIHITKLEALVRKVFQKGLDGDLGALCPLLLASTQRRSAHRKIVSSASVHSSLARNVPKIRNQFGPVSRVKTTKPEDSSLRRSKVRSQSIACST